MSCRFIAQINKKEYVLSASEFSIEKFKECLDCIYFKTYYEDYKCRHIDGYNCITLQTNHFKP